MVNSCDLGSCRKCESAFLTERDGRQAVQYGTPICLQQVTTHPELIWSLAHRSFVNQGELSFVDFISSSACSLVTKRRPGEHTSLFTRVSISAINFFTSSLIVDLKKMST